MQHFKKLLAILLCALLVFAVVACDGEKEPEKTDPKEPAGSVDPADPSKPADPSEPEDPDKLSLANIKVGFATWIRVTWAIRITITANREDGQRT